MSKSGTLLIIDHDVSYKRLLARSIGSMFTVYMGLPLPLPMGGMPPPIWSAPWPLLGFFTVSSTLRSRQAASEAAVMALDLTIAGSQTQASKLSAMSSLRTSTPYQVPSPACFCLSLFRMLVASNPALSHSWRAITSKALAMAPPPATMESFFMALLTIMIESWRLLSVSSMNCSAPPLRMMVHEVDLGQP